MDPHRKDKMIREGRTHLQIGMMLYKIQAENGMYSIHEHQYSASSWKEPCVEEITAMEGVKVVRGDMCASGMWQDSDKSEEGKERIGKTKTIASTTLWRRLKRRTSSEARSTRFLSRFPRYLAVPASTGQLGSLPGKTRTSTRTSLRTLCELDWGPENTQEMELRLQHKALLMREMSF